MASSGYDVRTITKNGRRTRKTCGFFTPQISSMGELSLCEANLEARSIRRTKTGNRANNASRFFAVVEALPHLALKVGKSHLLNKENNPMNKTNLLYTSTSGKQSPTSFSSRFKGVMYA